MTKSAAKKPVNRPAGRPRKDGRAPITREQILDAAQGLFAAQGFVGTGMRDICRKLDITPSSIFYQFPTKLSILEEIFANAIGPELEFYRRLEQFGVSAAVQLFVIIGTDAKYLSKAQAEMVSVIGLPEARNKKLTKVFEGRKKSIEHFKKLVRKGIKEGDFRAVDPKVMGELLTLLSEMSVYTTTEIGSPGHQAKQTVEFIFHALLKDPSTLPKIAKAAKRVPVKPPTLL